MADILIIDDDELLIELFSDILTDAGHTIRSATDGASGLAEAARSLPEMIVLDMYMPVLDGYAVVKALRADPATRMLPIVAVTGLNTPADHDAIRQAGCSAFIAKPIQPDHLVAVVRSLLAPVA